MYSVKKAAVIVLVVVLLLLDYAALDDITTGNEPNYYGEWATLAVSALVFGYLIYRYFKKKGQKK